MQNIYSTQNSIFHILNQDKPLFCVHFVPPSIYITQLNKKIAVIFNKNSINIQKL